jgi:hypothetical protein
MEAKKSKKVLEAKIKHAIAVTGCSRRKAFLWASQEQETTKDVSRVDNQIIDTE